MHVGTGYQAERDLVGGRLPAHVGNETVGQDADGAIFFQASDFNIEALCGPCPAVCSNARKGRRTPRIVNNALVPIEGLRQGIDNLRIRAVALFPIDVFVKGELNVGLIAAITLLFNIRGRSDQLRRNLVDLLHRLVGLEGVHHIARRGRVGVLVLRHGQDQVNRTGDKVLDLQGFLQRRLDRGVVDELRRANRDARLRADQGGHGRADALVCVDIKHRVAALVGPVVLVRVRGEEVIRRVAVRDVAVGGRPAVGLDHGIQDGEINFLAVCVCLLQVCRRNRLLGVYIILEGLTQPRNQGCIRDGVHTVIHVGGHVGGDLHLAVHIGVEVDLRPLHSAGGELVDVDLGQLLACSLEHEVGVVGGLRLQARDLLLDHHDAGVGDIPCDSRGCFRPPCGGEDVLPVRPDQRRLGLPGPAVERHLRFHDIPGIGVRYRLI